MVASSLLPNRFTIFDEDGNKMWEPDGMLHAFHTDLRTRYDISLHYSAQYQLPSECDVNIGALLFGLLMRHGWVSSTCPRLTLHLTKI